MAKSKLPTHRLKMKHKVSDRSSEVGAAWLNDDGSLTLQLNVGTVLDWRDNPDVVMTLFPTGV